MNNSAKAVLKSLLAKLSLLPGPVKLSNGSVSDYYFDCKRVTLSSEGAFLVGEVVLDVIRALPEMPKAVGGLTHGADPIISAVIMRAREQGFSINGFYVRKEPKKHGTNKLIENEPAPGTPVVIVDDVVTRGGSVLQAIDGAQRLGCRVIAVVTIIDRLEGGSEKIKEKVKNYVPLYDLEDFHSDIESIRRQVHSTKSELLPTSVSI